jgi:hypothetical protein
VALNKRDTKALNQVIDSLRDGPTSGGWEQLIIGRSTVPLTIEEQYRVDTLSLWLRTWILPTLERLATAHAKKEG